jgi:superfamily II DNA or RNA helicase
MTIQELHTFKEWIEKDCPTPNEIKTDLQTYALDKIITCRRGVLEAFTGFGKTFTGLQLIRRYRKVYSAPIYIIVPTQPLKELWELKVAEAGLMWNVSIHVINGYTMSDNVPKMCGLLIVDEVHRCLGESAKFFNTVLDTVCDFFVGFTATLDDKQREFLERKQAFVEFSISTDEGLELGIVPQFKIYNVVLPLTAEEQIAYYRADSLYNTQLEYFRSLTNDAFGLALMLSGKPTKTMVKFENLNEIDASYNDILTLVENLTGDDRKEIIGRAVMFRNSMQKRLRIVSNSEYKKAIIDQIITRVSNKKIIFMDSIESLKALNAKHKGFISVYHSKQSAKLNKNNLEAFKLDATNALAAVKSLDEGVDIPTLELLINKHFTTKERQFTQRLGRILRIDLANPDKLPIMLNLCSEPFQVKVHGNEVTVTPQDYKTIHKITRSKMFVETIKPIQLSHIQNLKIRT